MHRPFSRVELPSCRAATTAGDLRGRRAPFTLVELLVVVAIIAILAGMLLPALRTARERGRTTACLSNLRQINLAAEHYSSDYDDYLPHEGSFAAAVDNPAYNLWAWYNTLPPTIGLRPLAELFAEGAPPRPGVHSLFTCTSADPTKTAPTVTNARFMYGINHYMDPNGPALYRKTVAIDPSKTALFGDNNQANDPGIYGPRVPPRHQNGAVFAYVDGRAGWLHYAQYFRPTGFTSTDEWNGAWGSALRYYPFPGATN